MTGVLAAWLVFGIYSLAVVTLGLTLRHRRKSGTGGHDNLDFWLGRREIPGWMLGVSLASGWLMLGWIGFGMSQIYAYGATGLWILPIPWLILCFLIVVLVPHYRRVAAISLPQAIGRRFGPGARTLTAGFSLAVFLSWTGAELVMVKILIAPQLGLAGRLAFLAPALFLLPILVYTVMGGFRAVVLTDLLQFGLMAVFMLALGGWAWSQASAAAPEGILTALRAATPPWAEKGAALRLDFLGWMFPLALLVGYLPGWLIEQDLVLRIQAAPSTREARRGAWLGLVLIAVFIIAIPAFVAFAALLVFPPGTEAGMAVGEDFTGIITAFVRQMPGWLAMLMFLGMVACQMSTVDTFANVAAMPLAYDLTEPLLMRKASPVQVARMARIMSAAALLLALGYAAIADSLGDVYYLSSGVLSAAIAVPTLAVFWRRANRVGVLAGSVVGTLATILMYLWEYKVLQMTDPEAANYYLQVLPGWLAGACGYLYIGTGVLASAITLILVSLLSAPPTAELLAAVAPSPVDDPAEFATAEDA
jgi:SSS family solute:Na+ symporter